MTSFGAARTRRRAQGARMRNFSLGVLWSIPIVVAAGGDDLSLSAPEPALQRDVAGRVSIVLFDEDGGRSLFPFDVFGQPVSVQIPVEDGWDVRDGNAS